MTSPLNVPVAQERWSPRPATRLWGTLLVLCAAMFRPRPPTSVRDVLSGRTGKAVSAALHPVVRPSARSCPTGSVPPEGTDRDGSGKEPS